MLEVSKNGKFKIILNCEKIKNTIHSIAYAREYSKFRLKTNSFYYNAFIKYYVDQGFKIKLKNWFMAYFFNSICEIEISWKNLK